MVRVVRFVFEVLSARLRRYWRADGGGSRESPYVMEVPLLGLCVPTIIM